MAEPFIHGRASTSSSSPGLKESFQEIERDADSFTVSQTATSSSETVYGIGSWSGKMIQSIGEAALRGAENLGTRYKLHHIESVLKKDPKQWKVSVLEELLEYQRINFVYPDKVRRSAWDMIFIVMEKNGWQKLTSALASWDSEYASEERWFIRQLALCKLSGWTSHPVRENIHQPQEPLFNSAKASSAPRSKVLSENLAHILLFFLEKDPSIIHDTFNLDSFARLSAENVSQNVGPHIALSLFFNSFASLHPFPDIPPTPDVLLKELPKILAVYPGAHCLIQYLCTSPLEHREGNMKAVIEHILYSIRPFAAKEPQADQTRVVLRMHPYLQTPTVVNPTWSFLCFAILLTWQSADATNMLICNDIVGILKDLSRRYHERPMCLLYLALLTTMSIHHDLSQCSLKQNLEGWLSGKPRRKSSASSIRQLQQGTSVQPMSSEHPRSAPAPTFPLNQTLDMDVTPRDTNSSDFYRRYIIGDALAWAHRAVELDSQMRVKDAVASYAKSAELLVEAIKLKVQGGRPSRSAKYMKDSYDAYLDRMNVLCSARQIPLPHVSSPPPITTPPPASFQDYPPAYVAMLPSTSTPVDTLRRRNDQLLSIWQTDVTTGH